MSVKRVTSCAYFRSFFFALSSLCLYVLFTYFLFFSAILFIVFRLCFRVYIFYCSRIWLFLPTSSGHCVCASLSLFLSLSLSLPLSLSNSLYQRVFFSFYCAQLDAHLNSWLLADFIVFNETDSSRCCYCCYFFRLLCIAPALSSVYVCVSCLWFADNAPFVFFWSYA